MGTRGFITFVAGGVEKTAYNHFDSYPSGLGVKVLDFLRTQLTPTDEDCQDATPQAVYAAALAELSQRVVNLRVVRENVDEVTAEDVKRLAPWTDMWVGGPVDKGKLAFWYQLLRNTQYDPAAMLEAGVVEDASDFPADSLYAEWGYVIDLDEGLLEVYRGFVEGPHASGRFANRPLHVYNNVGQYYPVKLVKVYPLHEELPTDDAFVGDLEVHENE